MATFTQEPKRHSNNSHAGEIPESDSSGEESGGEEESDEGEESGEESSEGGESDGDTDTEDSFDPSKTTCAKCGEIFRSAKTCEFSLFFVRLSPHF